MVKSKKNNKCARQEGSGSPPVAGELKPAMPTISERTSAVLEGLRLVLVQHSAPETILKELKEQLHRYLDNSESERVWLKRVKYVLTYPLARYLRNEPPAQPEPSFSPVGALKRWMKARLSAFNRRNTHLWYSWLQAKRCALQVSDEFVEETYRDHFDGLTRADPASDEVVEDILCDSALQSVLSKLRTAVNRADLASFTSGRTSRSACFEQTRSQGGQLRELRNRARLPSCLLGQEFVRMDYYPWIHGRTKSYNVCVVVSEVAGRDLWNELTPKALAMDWESPLRATIQAVLEPLKVRVISKGEALPYYVARPLQRVLHTTLRQMDPFRLIGRPFCPTDLMDLREKAQPGDQWFSIDYSAATDGLSWKLSSALMKEVLRDCHPSVLEMASRVLGPHRLFYPVQGKKKPVERGLQSRGQLMGSILSFPFLCLANLAVYLKTMRVPQWQWTVQERLRHVLINGDDMVYTAHPQYWQVHTAVGRSVGLEMSVGKAYVHPVYANVNSTSVHYDLNDAGSSPWQIDYLNTGLYFDRHKVQGTLELAAAHMSCQEAEVKTPLSSSLNVLLRGCLPTTSLTEHVPTSVYHVLTGFLKKHSTRLREECLTKSGMVRNLFIPQSFGGMGVVPPVGWGRHHYVSSAQRRVAAEYLRSSARASYGSPVPGFELHQLETEVEVPWYKTESSSERLALRGSKVYQVPKRLMRWGLYLYDTVPGRVHE